jgi:hypothetical protein
MDSNSWKQTGDSVEDIGVVVEDVTRVIDKEVMAFQNLWDSLYSHKALRLSIGEDSTAIHIENMQIKGNASILSNEIPNGTDGDRYQRLNRCRAMISSRILPIIEQRSIERLNELKDILLILMQKLQKRNALWVHPIKRSIEVLNQCICLMGKNGNG